MKGVHSILESVIYISARITNHFLDPLYNRSIYSHEMQKLNLSFKYCVPSLQPMFPFRM
jgi:hypothetical protein